MLFDKIPNQNHRSQKSFTRIRQIRQLPLCFPKNCVRIRQTCISMRRVPRAQRAFGEKALHFHSAERRVKTRIDRLLKKIQPFSLLTAKRQTHLWKDSCLFQPNRTAHQNKDKSQPQINTAIPTSQPNVKRAVDDALLQQNQGKRRRKCPPAPAPFAFKEIH